MKYTDRLKIEKVSWCHPLIGHSARYTMSATPDMDLFGICLTDSDGFDSDEVLFWAPKDSTPETAKSFLATVAGNFIEDFGHGLYLDQHSPVSDLWDIPNVERYIKRYVTGPLIPPVNSATDVEMFRNVVDASERYLYRLRKTYELVDSLKREKILYRLLEEE